MMRMEAVLAGCAMAQGLLIYCLLETKTRAQVFSSFQWLSLLFFLSGFAALSKRYQKVRYAPPGKDIFLSTFDSDCYINKYS